MSTTTSSTLSNQKNKFNFMKLYEFSTTSVVDFLLINFHKDWKFTIEIQIKTESIEIFGSVVYIKFFENFAFFDINLTTVCGIFAFFVIFQIDGFFPDQTLKSPLHLCDAVDFYNAFWQQNSPVYFDFSIERFPVEKCKGVIWQARTIVDYHCYVRKHKIGGQQCLHPHGNAD